MSPHLDPGVVHELALKEKVCVRPILHRVTDRETGAMTVVVMPCRSTRESRCPSCADAARRLRMQQCAEGWHLDHEPELWFSEGPTTRTRTALALCEDCPVRRLCLAYALVFREEFGVWGGLAVDDRRPLEARLVHGAPLGDVLASALEPGTSALEGAA